MFLCVNGIVLCGCLTIFGWWCFAGKRYGAGVPGYYRTLEVCLVLSRPVFDELFFSGSRLHVLFLFFSNLLF